MVVDVVVGLQWGSEFKGKVVSWLADEYNAVIREGGPQAGHTFIHPYTQEKYVNRVIPCGVVNPYCKLYIAAGGMINLDVFNKEKNEFNVYPNSLMIDPHTMVVTDEHIKQEMESSLYKRLASTREGVGAARVDKLWRTAKLFKDYAKENLELYCFMGGTVEGINEQLDLDHNILFEGTQGMGLDLNLGFYPYVTSTAVNPSALLGGAGIAPNFHGKTIGAMRTYPIRVGGPSGPTGSKELTWKEISRRCGRDVLEHTSVTHRVRRVFEQDYDWLEESIRSARPSEIALSFIDYINGDDFGKTNYKDLSKKSKKYIDDLEKRLNIPITLVGTGPATMIDRRKFRKTPVKCDHLESWEDRELTDEWYDQYYEGLEERVKV